MYNPQNTVLDITKVHIYHDRGQRAQQLDLYHIYL